MQSLAVGWQIYNLTDSAFDLGLVGLMQFLPLVSLMLVAGQVADRYDRRTIVQVSLAVTGLSVAVLAVGTAAGWINRDVILVTILIFGSARAFQTPTTAALLPAVVPTERLVARGRRLLVHQSDRDHRGSGDRRACCMRSARRSSMR